MPLRNWSVQEICTCRTSFQERDLIEEENDVTYLKDAVNGNLSDTAQLIPLLEKYRVTDVVIKSDNQAMINILASDNWYLAGSSESYVLYKKAS